MKTLLLSTIISLLTVVTTAQGWLPVTNSPVNNYRHDDFYFISPDTGWITNQVGSVFRTYDGGVSWDTLVNSGPFHGRSIGFFNGQSGILGQYGISFPGSGIDSNAVFLTHDGGVTWNPVLNYNGPPPVGICGISVVNEMVAFGVGRWESDARFIKTTDGGASFTATDLTALSGGLVDCHFFSPDTGIIVGRSSHISASKSVPSIWHTVDGGTTWQNVYSGSDSARWCWKINFISRDTGFVSVENHWGLAGQTPVFILKTTDGGLSWTKIPVAITPYSSSRLQGIGFISADVGYTGEGVIRKTVDGGQTWVVTNEMYNFNRYRSVNDSVKYAIGNRLYKYHFTPTSIIESPVNSQIEKINVSPNPVLNSVKISYTLKSSVNISISMYNQAGIMVFEKVVGVRRHGIHDEVLDLIKLPPGAYHIIVATDGESRSAVIVKQ